MQLDDELKQELINRIKEGKDIPESFKIFYRVKNLVEDRLKENLLD